MKGPDGEEVEMAPELNEAKSESKRADPCTEMDDLTVALLRQ